MEKEILFELRHQAQNNIVTSIDSLIEELTKLKSDGYKSLVFMNNEKGTKTILKAYL